MKETKGKSLLRKTLTQFVICASTCLVVTAPLFYLLTKNYYAEDMIDIIESVKNGQGIPPLDLEEDIMAGMMLQFLLIFIVIFAAMYVTLRFATKRLWHPFDDTLQKAERFNLAQGQLPEFQETDILEFARLNNSLQQLMAKDSETYRIQKEFTENASHELQTPLAIIRGKLDLLMQENLNEKQMTLVSDLYELTIRMGNLNRNLLLLAKIENSQYDKMEEVDVAAMLTKNLPLYATLQQENTLRLRDIRSDKECAILANATLLECLLKNLVVNAIRHTPQGREILITVSETSLTVSNPSADGLPLDGDTMFRRFHTDGATQGSNGLGLAIVKAICDFHHWTIEYGFTDNEHKFTVDFCHRQGKLHAAQE